MYAINKAISFPLTPDILVASPTVIGLTSFKPSLAMLDIPFIKS